MMPNEATGLDIPLLTKAMDKAKHGIFLGPQSTFYGGLCCNLNQYWTTDCPTAYTNGISLGFNPDFFLSLPPESRKTLLKHELDHVAYLHPARRGSRDPLLWNYACDFKINNENKLAGYSFEGLEDALLDDRFIGMFEEQIYDILEQENFFTPIQFMIDLDDDAPVELTKQMINNVNKILHQTRLTDRNGVPGYVESIINQFLAPVVPWEHLLHRFFHGLVHGGHTWSKRNRRYPNMIMPARHKIRNQLDHLLYCEDVSGSIKDQHQVRFNSEFAYVKRRFQPKKMTLLQFNTEVTDVREYHQHEPFNQVKIKGKGGTSLVKVRDYIIENRPTAVVVFSDLDCAPMEHLGFDIPIIWITINNPGAQVNQGIQVHIEG